MLSLTASDADSTSPPDPQSKDVTVAVDDLLALVAEEVPAFGGAYIGKDGKLELRIVGESGSAATAAQNRLAELIAPDLASEGITVLGAQFAFHDLRRWRALITTELLGTEGVVRSTIGDGRNRVIVGVTDLADHKMAVQKEIESLGVPSEAVILEETPPLVPESDLNTFHRPLVGGLGIYSYDTELCCCTLGFTATRQGSNGFVTASHCATFSVLNGEGWGQPDAAHAVGWEVFDTPGFSCNFGQCRAADIEWDRTLVGTNILRGYLARTTPPPATAWNGTNLWRIAGEMSALEGQTIRKVGRSTGYTGGTVTSNCDDFFFMGVTLLCQHSANYSSSSGDSGAPVFKGTGAAQDVLLAGTHVGVFGISRVFSPISGIQSSSELGLLTNCAAGLAC